MHWLFNAGTPCFTRIALHTLWRGGWWRFKEFMKYILIIVECGSITTTLWVLRSYKHYAVFIVIWIAWNNIDRIGHIKECSSAYCMGTLQNLRIQSEHVISLAPVAPQQLYEGLKCKTALFNTWYVLLNFSWIELLLDTLQAWVLRSQHNAHELLLRIFQILDQKF